MCFCCRAIAGSAFSEPVVVPIALARNGDPLHRTARRYKDAPAVAARREARGRLSSMVGSFLSAHSTCLAEAGVVWDAVAVVPSGTRQRRAGAPGPGVLRPATSRPPPHPFDLVCGAVPLLASGARVDLSMRRGVVGHLRPDATACSAPSDLHGCRVLLVDDVWVTGAHAWSALGALERSGAVVTGVLVGVRLVDPDAAPAIARWWDVHAAGAAVKSARCCLAWCRASRSAITEPLRGRAVG
jgi:hypothetical protein